VLAFSWGLALVLGASFGVAPTLSALRLDVQRSLARGAGEGPERSGAGRVRRMLVGVQAALATLLLVGAGLLGLTIQNLGRVELGFETANILRVSVALPTNRYPADFSRYPDWPERLGFVRDALDRIEAIPGVSAVALTTNHSLDPGFTNSINIEGAAPDPGRGEPTTRMITPGYFDVAGLRLLDGRLLDETDTHESRGVVLLNRSAALRYFPDGDALGARIAFWGLGFRDVVGIVEDERVAGPRSTPPPAFYTSLLQTPPAGGGLTFMVRTRGDALRSAAPVRDAIASLDPELAVFNVTTMDATLAAAKQRERFAGVLLGAFALMALVLAATGVYGVLSYSVARRTRELGVRLALGADRTSVRLMVVRQGTTLVALGIVAGLVAARLAAQTIEGLLFGVEAGAPSAYVATACSLLLVALAASFAPAWRASAVSPARALQSD
jgi:predicted permease